MWRTCYGVTVIGVAKLDGVEITKNWMNLILKAWVVSVSLRAALELDRGWWDSHQCLYITQAVSLLSR